MSSTTVGKYVVLPGLHYTEEHEWVSVQADGNVKTGITDYAQKSLHEVVYVDLPKAGSIVNQMETIGTVESVKSVSEIYSPLSGEIIMVNERLRDSPELVNDSPYEEGWLAMIKPKALNEELKNLLTPELYAERIKQLVKEA